MIKQILIEGNGIQIDRYRERQKDRQRDRKIDRESQLLEIKAKQSIEKFPMFCVFGNLQITFFSCQQI